MKVGINTLFLIPGEVGGSETYLMDVLRCAVARHTGIQWVLFTNSENHDLFLKTFSGRDTVRLWPLKFKARNRVVRILQEQTRLPWAARQAGVDVLWSPGYTAPLWSPCPQVVSVLDMQYKEFPQDLSPLALWATRILVPAAVRVARRVITISEYGRSQIMRYTNASAERIVPIHLAANLEFGSPGKGTGASQMPALETLHPYILCVAHTYPHKNVHTLVKAFSLIKGDFPGKLVLVGTPQRGEPLVRSALDEMATPDRVLRFSRLNRSDLIALYQGASIFAFPSLYEGFGLPVLEAMTAGTPVIAAARGPMKEIGGDTISYFDGTAPDLAVQIRRLASLDGNEREALIRRAQARAQTFSWEHTADQTITVFRECVSKR